MHPTIVVSAARAVSTDRARRFKGIVSEDGVLPSRDVQRPD